MKEELIKELLYWLAAIWLGWLPIVYQMLWSLDVLPLYIIGILIMLGAGDALFFAYIKYYWGIEKEDIEPIEPPVAKYYADSGTVYTIDTNTDTTEP